MEKLMAAKTLEDWQKMRDGLSYRNQAFIDGKYVDAASGKTFDCTSPIDGRLLAKVAECDKEDVDRAVKAARKAFEAGKWSEASPAKRKAVMLKLAQLVRENSDELALLETLDMGKPVMMAKNVDMNGVANNFQWYGEAIDKMYDEIAPTDRSGLGLITREPMGVVGAVVPWNFPLMMAAWKLAPMLATGNSVVLKPAEQSPLTAIRLAELAMEAGIPEGVLNVLPGFGETAGQALGMHMDVDGISFTGSTEVGKYFLKYSGLSNMKAIALECGGKTPNIVMKDAPNLEAAAREAGSAIFFNSGQVCLASSRLLVEQDIKDEFLEKVKEVGQFMQPGDPLDPKTMMGTMVDNTQTKRVLGYIEAGQKEGAKLVLGGKQVRQNTGGEYIEPTIFDNVKNSMKIAQEEIFGPVLSTLTFKDAEEAIQIANDSVYGLYANLWTNDLTKAHKMARKIRAGTVNINNTNGGGLVMPFGGYKQSGLGRDGSLHAMEKFTQMKATYIHLG
jgi:acyl-CoA reductase-like NAD-dependent aldehyde dehydrogenase